MKKIETEIEIKASAEKVWAVLTDFAAYPEWNPFIRKISGDPQVGSKLSAYIKPEGGMGANLAPVVVRAEPNSAFAWKGNIGISGIFDAHHEFILDRSSSGNVLFIHREQFSGLLVPLFWPMLEKNTRSGFENMNAALKAAVEKS